MADAAAFFVKMVRPTVDEFLSDRSDRRRACIACLMLASMVDHYFHTNGAVVAPHKNANAYRDSVKAENWPAGIMIDIANATKHVQRIEAKNEKPRRVGFDDISSLKIAVGTLRAGWPINGQEVVVEIGPNYPCLVSQLVEAASSYWAAKIAALG
jgi:hypothetical protein